MAVAVFVCNNCGKDFKSIKQYYSCYIGEHSCRICGRIVDCSKETYNVFDKIQLEAKGVVKKAKYE